MPLVVEDGTGIAEANSYVSLEEANTYHATHSNTLWKDRLASTTLFVAENFTGGETLTIGDGVWVMKTSISVAGDVRIGTDLAASLASLAAAINGTGQPGVDYHAGTEASSVATAAAGDASIVLTAIEEGDQSEVTLLLEDAPDTAVIRPAVFEGNEDLKTPALIKASRVLDDIFAQDWQGDRRSEDQGLDWPRCGVYGQDGELLDEGEIPQAVKDAVCEAALLILQGEDLLPNKDAAGNIKRERVKAGSIEEEIEYSGAKISGKIYQALYSRVSRYAVPAGTVRRG